MTFPYSGSLGDKQALRIWLCQAWTLAAFGEEMVFRGYLIRRVCDLVGDAPAGRAIALIAAGTIGGVLGLLYFASGRNLSKNRFWRLGILGTRYAMEGPVYSARLAERDVASEIPDPSGRERVNAIVFDELVRGELKEESRRY